MMWHFSILLALELFRFYVGRAAFRSTILTLMRTYRRDVFYRKAL
jgi:hypothetical protein